jgi:hypothetical protein
LSISWLEAVLFRNEIGDEGPANGGTPVLDYRVNMAEVVECPEGGLYVFECLGELGATATFQVIVDHLEDTEFTIYSLTFGMVY